MPATVTILAAVLACDAADAGTTPEAVAAVRLAEPPAFRKLAGTLLSDLTDASVRTDNYQTCDAVAVAFEPEARAREAAER